jgi:hypothetical protein
VRNTSDKSYEAFDELPKLFLSRIIYEPAEGTRAREAGMGEARAALFCVSYCNYSRTSARL